MIDREGRISECNGAFGKSLALESGTAAGKMLDELVAPGEGAMAIDA